MTPASTQTALRRAALHSLWMPPLLAADVTAAIQNAIEHMGFLQADPIRAPARAQDLILRQRVKNYREGDLERLYPQLDGIEEECFVNYGFMPRRLQQHLHPRSWDNAFLVETAVPHLLAEVLDFIKLQNSPVHPQHLQQHFGRQPLGNAWGGTSQATTRVLDHLHRKGLLRVAGRDKGIKLYSAASHLKTTATLSEKQAQACTAAVIRAIVALYQPLPASGLTRLLYLSGYGAPQLQAHLKTTLARMKAHELARDSIDGSTWLRLRHRDGVALDTAEWLAAQQPSAAQLNKVRLLAPFDPVVWDRERFEQLHGWAYKFEAYVPAPKRKLGYYALPLLWQGHAVGWANVSLDKSSAVMTVQLRYTSSAPSSAVYSRELDAELARMPRFLGATATVLA